MEDITRRSLDIIARMMIHSSDFDDSRQAFSVDELNDRLCDYIDKVTDTYQAHRNCIHDAYKYTGLIVLGILAILVTLTGLATIVVLACWSEMDMVVAIIASIGLLGFVIFAIIQTDFFNYKRKNCKILAEQLQMNITDLYLGVIVITWPLTHKEDNNDKLRKED